MLSKVRGDYKIVSSIAISHLPIRVLQTRTNGWRDLAVRVRGGGILPGYEALLAFDGMRYPENPSGEPARPAPAGAAGDVAIPSDDAGQLLY